MKRKCSLAFLFLLVTAAVNAQQFGGFPPSTRWKQINTDTARIIFTADATQPAQRIATLIQRVAADTPFSLGNRVRKINIVLQSHTTTANGYVALAPFRSEFYLIPGANVYDFGNLPWQENLAVHEYRHVQQYNNFNHGLSKAFFYLFGEGGQAFANAITVPGWFFEGDAVHSETALTPQGRGRLPYFLSGYNSLWREGKNYSWQKLRNGSLKDYVPNHYQLGYLLVNYGYQKYGASFWKEVTQDATAFKGLFYPFQQAIARHSGLSFPRFRKETFEYYRSRMEKQPQAVVPQKTVSSYYYPQYISQDSLLYLKTSYNRLPAFYIRDKNGEHRLALQSISNEEWFSYRNKSIAYTAYSTHARWSLNDYSDVVVMDLNSHLERRITRGQKYYTPDFSPSGDQLVCVRVNDSLQTELQVIDRIDGHVVHNIPPAASEYFTNPRFVDEGHILAGVRSPDARMSLQMYDLQSRKWEVLVPYSYYTISLPFVHGGSVYFTANFSGYDEIYELELSGKNMSRLTRTGTGTYFPSVARDSLVYSVFTARGLQLQAVSLKNIARAPFAINSLQQARDPYPVAAGRNLLSQPTRNFPSAPYSKSKGLLNFHSWRPDYSDPEFTFSLYSDNVLSTFSNELFYRYNQNEQSHGIGWNTYYGGLFTQINGGIEYTYGRSFRDTARRYTFDEFEARIGLSIPLNLTRGKGYRLFNVGSDYVINQRTPTGPYKDLLRLNNPRSLHHYLSWANYLPRAVQHIYPKLGYTLSLHYRDRLDRKGYQAFSLGQVFLPSIGNHSIVLSASYQDTDSNSVFSNRFALSRGYTDLYFARAWRFSANYHFPIFYPDLGIASIVYFQRLRGNLFYDATEVYSRKKTSLGYLRSAGGELYFDTKWWNELSVSIGIRLSYLLDDGFTLDDRRGTTWFELILPLSLKPD